jgi:G:T-mismatch repair DNA endonuclease (very short patch repair protein)
MITCENCKIEFIGRKNSKFCNRICYNKFKNSKTVKLKCKNCNSNFFGYKNRKFCNLFCAHKYNGKIGLVGGDRSSLSSFVKKYGKELGELKYEEKNNKISLVNKGKPSGMKGKTHSNKTKDKISNSIKNSVTHKAYIEDVRKNGFSEEKKEHLRECMKGIFGLNWFIKKYGEIEGKLKYEDRNKIISKNLALRASSNKSYSKKSQKLFWDLYKRLCLENKKVYFAELNHEYSCGTKTNFDFVLVDKKKVIEFNGNIWHANPKYFNENEFMWFANKTAKEVWLKDEMKNNAAINKGFEVLIIWESDFDCNRKEAIKKCVDFLCN